MPEHIQCEAIVLKTIPYREHDLLVDLMTEVRGRVTGIARHATKSKRRFGPLLAAPNILNLQFKDGGLIFLEEVSLSEPLSHLYDDLDKMASAHYFLDCFRSAVHEGSPDAPLYHLLRSSLQALHRQELPRQVLPRFQYQFLRLLGFQPHLEGCARCGKKDEERFFFLYREGGLTCLKCLLPQESFFILPAGAVALLKSWGQGAPSSNAAGWTEVAQFLPRFLEYQLGRQLRSSLIIPKLLSKG